MRIPRPFRRLPNRGGFTLVELLVVISVIAVLAGILVPAMGMVRALAHSTKCQSNLRQFGLANFSYAQDWDGSLVPVYITDGSGSIPNPTRWDYNADYLNRIAESSSGTTTGWKLAKGITCPVAKAANAGGGVNVNYAMNDYVVGGGSAGTPNKIYAWTLARMKPGVFMITDALDYKINPVISSFNPASWQASWEGTVHGDTIALRHRQRANAVMYDGSVTTFAAGDYVITSTIWR